MKKNSNLYIADNTHIVILNLKLETLSSWKLPKEPPSVSFFRGLKVNGETIYLTVQGLHQFFLCTSHDGKLLKEFGTVVSSSKDGEFQSPLGLTVDNKFIYICDCWNHRVQILIKENGSYFSKWGNGRPSSEQGQFDHPRSIYNYLSEELIYVGDYKSVQLFRKEDGICIQRIGDKKLGNQMSQFWDVYGICVMDDRLYISDFHNRRIQIFKRAIY